MSGKLLKNKEFKTLIESLYLIDEGLREGYKSLALAEERLNYCERAKADGFDLHFSAVGVSAIDAVREVAFIYAPESVKDDLEKAFDLIYDVIQRGVAYVG